MKNNTHTQKRNFCGLIFVGYVPALIETNQS
jgi:hypothetical protein